MITRFKAGTKKINEFLNKHADSRTFLIIASFLTCFILTLVASYAAVFIHELGHAIATLILFPNAGSAIYLLEGFTTSYPFPVDAWRLLLVFEGGPIASFIALNLVAFAIIPHLKPERHVMKLALLFFCVVSIWNSTLYHALAMFKTGGDTRTVADVLNWWWGLSFIQGDAPFDSGIILAIIGSALSVVYILLIYKRFKIEMSAFLGQRLQNTGKKFRRFIPIAFYGAMYPVYYFIYAWISMFLIYGRYYGNFLIDFWTAGYFGLVLAMLMGLACFGLIGLIAWLNRVFVRRNDPSQYHANIKVLSVFVLASFFVVLFPIIIVHNYNQDRTTVYFQEGYMIRITYGSSLYQEAQVGSFSTPSGIYGVYEFQNFSRQGVMCYGFRLSLAETLEGGSSKYIFLQNSTSIDYDNSRFVAPVLLPNMTLWIFTAMQSIKANGIDVATIIVARIYDLSGIVYGSAPSTLGLKSSFVVPSSNVELNNFGSIMNATYDNVSKLIWLTTINYTRTCNLTLINPTSRTILSTRAMNSTTIGHGNVFLRNGTAYCLYSTPFKPTSWWVVSSADNGTTWSSPKLLYTCRADETLSFACLANDVLLFTSRFNHDLWMTTFSIPASFSILQEKIRVTKTFEDEGVNFIMNVNGTYYLSCYSSDGYGNAVFSLYKSSTLLAWDLVS